MNQYLYLKAFKEFKMSKKMRKFNRLSINHEYSKKKIAQKKRILLQKVACVDSKMSNDYLPNDELIDSCLGILRLKDP